MPDATPRRDPNADVIARERGLAASHAARRDAESGVRDPWWLHCDVPRFLAFLEQLERERGIRHEQLNA